MAVLETLLAYVPQDRRQALAAGRELPHQTQGAALWADLSGFTPLTESLAHQLGARRGAEELALQLNRFYEALIAPVQAYGGSVIDFSGDAINCWFEADDGRRALAAAQAMQAAMQPFGSLQLLSGDVVAVGVKIAIASGAMRRFLVGDPAIQLLDTLAGSMMDRLGQLGHLAGTGEVLVDEATAAQLQPFLQIRAWRVSVETGQRGGVVGNLDIQVEPSPQTVLPDLIEEQIRPWLLPAVFARLQGQQGEFLTELRPAAALFMRFDGLDYEGDERAGHKLDGFIRRVQHILAEYEGALLQLTLGDKGSYLYAAFGAPLAHENDGTRAVTAALALRQLPTQVESIHSVSIGLSRGTMRTGAYGSAMRRTYGVLGDEVNLAARLMQRAAPGEVLVSEAIWQAAPGFDWQVQPPFEAKGKGLPVRPAVLLGRREQAALRLSRTTAMIGRGAELARVEEKLEWAGQGQGQVVSISAEAGMGKSRLLAEVLQRAGDVLRYGGECQSYGTHSAYLVWHAIWRAFFGVNPANSSIEQIETLEKALGRINPDFPLRLPLLGPVLNLSIPDNSLTNGMDARSRKALRESMLVDCLRERAAAHPLVLILEDAHWIDPLSSDLLELIGRTIRELPVLVLLAYRPPAESEAAAFLSGLTNLEYVTQVRLAELTYEETGQLITSRLAYMGLDGDVSPTVVERLSARTQGNPFYIEELLNYLHDRDLDPRLEDAWEQVALPDSLHSLILSRIDRLAERQQITLKAASVIGRLFRATWLYEYYPPLGGPAQVSADLEALNRLEFTLLETLQPNLAYLFKHVITQEAAYESLAYATRAALHGQFARYLELAAGEDVGPFLDLLAYHYERSDNLPKKREYLRKAGEAAQNTFANQAALSYLGRALALAPETDYAGRFDLLFVRKQVYDLLGEIEAHKQDMTSLAALAEHLDDRRRAQAALARSKYALEISDYPAALVAAQQAVAFARLAGAEEYEARGYLQWGNALHNQGIYAEARVQYKQALAQAQAANLNNWMVAILRGLGDLDIADGNYDGARAYFERALQVHGEGMGHRLNQAVVLYALGQVAAMCGDFTTAQVYYEQALQAFRLMGKRRFEGTTLYAICQMITEQRGDYVKAKLYGEQALRLSQESGYRNGEMYTLSGLSFLDLAQNNYLAARTYVEQALSISREIGTKSHEAGYLAQLGSIADELGEYVSAVAYQEQGLSIAHEMGDREGMGQTFMALGMAFYHWGQHETAQEKSWQALKIAQESKNKLAQTRALLLLGHVLRELGDLDGAADAYQQALALALELGLPDCYARQAQTGLAWIAFTQGRLAEAQAPLDEILHYLASTPLSTMDEIFWIYLTCTRILQAAADPRARATLDAAYHLLQTLAAGIDDQALRGSFLQNVRCNCEIVEAWGCLAAL